MDDWTGIFDVAGFGTGAAEEERKIKHAKRKLLVRSLGGRLWMNIAGRLWCGVGCGDAAVPGVLDPRNIPGCVCCSAVPGYQVCVYFP